MTFDDSKEAAQIIATLQYQIQQLKSTPLPDTTRTLELENELSISQRTLSDIQKDYLLCQKNVVELRQETSQLKRTTNELEIRLSNTSKLTQEITSLKAQLSSKGDGKAEEEVVKLLDKLEKAKLVQKKLKREIATRRSEQRWREEVEGREPERRFRMKALFERMGRISAEVAKGDTEVRLTKLVIV